MELTLIGILLALIIGAVLIFYLTHKILKVLFFVIGAGTLAIIIIGGFIVVDAKNFQDKIQEENNLFIITSNDKPVALIPIGPDLEQLNSGQENQIMQNLNKKSYNSLLNDYYKLFFVKVKILDSIKQENFQMEGLNFTKQQIKDALISKNPFQSLGIDENLIPKNLTASNLKMGLFMSTIQEQITSNPVFLLKEYKTGNIHVYKETIMFKALKYIPVSFVKSLVNKAKSKIKLGNNDGNI